MARSSTFAAALVALAAFLSATAEMQAAPGSRICRQLAAELAGGGRPDAQARRLDSSIAAQRKQIEVLRGQIRAGGCRSSIFGVSGSASCKAAGGRVADMERNLRTLERQRGQSADGQRRSRATILASLDENDCRARPARQAARQPEQSGLFARLFGGRVERREPVEDEAVIRQETAGPGRYGPAGRVRTLCVRSCDGYFFPMSAASSSRDFARDQKNCEAACPGAAVEVYYHDLRGEESADMVSARSGTPYTQLPTAFAYKREARTENCTCQRSRQYEVMGGEHFRTSALTRSSTPEDGTGAQAAEIQSQGSFVTFPAPAPPSPSPIAAAEEDGAPLPQRDMDDRKVRVVGPVFLPDPEEAIGLQAPDPTDGP